MAQAMINFRMDSEEKHSLEEICEQLGISITSAFKMFAKKVIRERRIPFDVSLDDSRSDPFWSEENQAWLRESIKQAKEGRLTEHELIEVD
ncbi:MAG: type II toxin-antitoxin system RelB/DinJ family antitoxin [Treponema sp.]|jgi:DNA-damage-inducible protein J|nr:type II toxin-antitoxin system RelB/DinJ family antitoxin [Treponema sp.]